MSDISDPRPLLADANRSAHVRGEIAGFHKKIVDEVRSAVERDTMVVVGMAWNPFVKKACAALTQAKIPFTYLEYGNYTNNWRERLAIKMWSGWPTFPQVFVKGTLIGGFTELQGKLEDGSLKSELG